MTVQDSIFHPTEKPSAVKAASQCAGTEYVKGDEQSLTQNEPQRTVCPGCLWAAWGAPDRAICSRVPCARAADARALAAKRKALGIDCALCETEKEGSLAADSEHKENTHPFR